MKKVLMGTSKNRLFLSVPLHVSSAYMPMKHAFLSGSSLKTEVFRDILILLLLFSVIAVFCFAADPSDPPDPAEGYWLSVDEKTGKVTGGWHIYVEENKMLGRVLSMADYSPDILAVKCKDSYPGFPVAGKVNQMPVAGTIWMYGLTMVKPGEWTGGSVVNPEDGRVYKCKVFFRQADGKKFKTDVLEMRGEIGLGIGRSQFWQRSDQRTASSLGPR